MRTLFEFDFKNYEEHGTVGRRPSVRGIIIKDGKVALVHSLKYDYFKFPGGGIKKFESHSETLLREVEEETGLIVIPSSITEYGLVFRKEKGRFEDIFIQENFYYFCEVEEKCTCQKLDQYETDEQFVLEWADPIAAIDANRNHDHFDKDSELAQHMMEREARVLALLVDEGYFKSD
ncbi:MAG: NUDIX domain-containing protein [Lachnospiraceae bacterium]|jgi:8-oxo-dGTP pyrophosphatase MutT (NUDIX family)|nr:NUDIX domain-containing protein [Lachnospiraceae bacterium]